MGKKPLVSSIIIFWNEERYIEEAIASVFAQTYDHWELLLVDDGSSDKSTEIAKQYEEKYPGTVRYIEHNKHENRGMSASRNLGVRNSKGKYISFLDADDVWRPEKLEEQVAILEIHPKADMVHGPLQMWFSWSGKPKDLHRDYLYGLENNRKHPYADTLVEPPLMLALFLRYEEFMPGGFMVKRDVMKKVGIFEENFFDNYSDAVALVKICLTSHVFVSSKSWYKYRKHKASYTYLSNFYGKDIEEQRIYLDWVAEYFNHQRVNNPQLWAILHKRQIRNRYEWLYRFMHSPYQFTKKQARLFISRLGIV